MNSCPRHKSFENPLNQQEKHLDNTNVLLPCFLGNASYLLFLKKHSEGSPRSTNARIQEVARMPHLFFFKRGELLYTWRNLGVKKITIIKTVHLPFRFRDGQTIPMLKKNTIKRWKNHPMESYFLKQNLFLLIQTQPQLPSSRKTGFPPPFPDTNAHRLGFLHLTSKSVCKQEAAEVGGCETGEPEDRSENAPVEQKLDLATLLSFRVTSKPVHPQRYRKRPESHPPEPWWQRLGPEGKPWRFPLLSPVGRETSANKLVLLVGVAAKWSFCWQLSYLMETHTPPPAASPKGLKRAKVSAVSLPPGEQRHQSPDRAQEHTSGTWKRSPASQCPVQPALPGRRPKGSLDGKAAFFCQKLLPLWAHNCFWKGNESISFQWSHL